MKNNYNYGLALLRTIMCFMVVLCHFWDGSNATGFMKCFSFIRVYAVSVFIFMSFALVQKTFVIHDMKIVKIRFERLLIPQIAWSVVYWVVYLLMDLFFYHETELRITDMFWQIFTGHSPRLNSAMWYQVDLIYLTLLFLIIIAIFKNNYQKVLWVLGLVALIIQYSGINMIFDVLRYELKYPIGRFFEMLPLAVLGFTVASGDTLERISKHKIMVVVTSVTVIGLTAIYDIFTIPKGYGYSGVNMLVVSFSFFALFYVIPFDKVNEKIINLINIFSQYTMGIYFVHIMIGRIVCALISKCGMTIIKNDSFVECIAIYIISYFCSFIGVNLFGRTKLKLMFN